MINLKDSTLRYIVYPSAFLAEMKKKDRGKNQRMCLEETCTLKMKILRREKRKGMRVIHKL